MDLSKYDEIRPFEPAELPAAFDRMLSDRQFQSLLAYLYPGVPVEAVAAKMRRCRDCIEFQKAFCYSFLKELLAKASTGCDMDAEAIDLKRRHTFVSNHRDIVLDSALLSVMLAENSDTTCEIAIGDNLLAAPWIKDLVRINKSFIVLRSAGMREMLVNSRRMSEYMHIVINAKNDNVWIAQREGRAKDSDDRTQPSILKMMAMGGEGTVVERLKQLHIVPLAISYEYDPCDFLKAQEFQMKRDIEGWKKTKADDVNSMQTGIMGYKGGIHYHCAPCIDGWLDTLADVPKGEVFDVVARHIDGQIHANYRLYANNYIALDKLNGTRDNAGKYTDAQKAAFEKYLEGQLAKIQIDNKDEEYLMNKMLLMYANPAKNKLAVKG